MSSRVRLMLQDFDNGVSWTGKSAFRTLQGLYDRWAANQTKSTKTSRVTWNKVSERYAQDHPFLAQAISLPGPDIDWEGPGFYVRSPRLVEVPAKTLEPLPKGPKWLQALEMWERLTPSLSEHYRLFVSRDNRRQTWRRSLCNPYFQEWGFKVWPTKPKAPNKAKRAAASGDRGTWLDRVLERDGPMAAPTRGQVPANQSKTPKPRVGIWSS